MNANLTTLISNSLPALSGSKVTYNRQRGMYVTESHTTAIGHSYYQGIKLSNRIAVVYDIGEGGWGFHPTFLNGVKVYCNDGNQKKLIGSWAPANWCFYNELNARGYATRILSNYLKSQVKMNGLSVSDKEIDEYCEAQILAAEHEC